MSDRVFAWGVEGGHRVGRFFPVGEVPEGWEISGDEDRPLRDGGSFQMRKKPVQSGDVYKHIPGGPYTFKSGSKREQKQELKSEFYRRTGKDWDIND